MDAHYGKNNKNILSRTVSSLIKIYFIKRILAYFGAINPYLYIYVW